jgi:hypothetical protein
VSADDDVRDSEVGHGQLSLDRAVSLRALGRDESPTRCDTHVRTCRVNSVREPPWRWRPKSWPWPTFRGINLARSRGRSPDQAALTWTTSARVIAVPVPDAQALDETVGWPGTCKSWPWPTSANSTADRAVRLRASRRRCRRARVCVPYLLNSVHQLGV